MDFSNVIYSLNTSQDDVLRNIVKLYIPEGRIHLDCTYSKGVFYKNLPELEPLLKSDLNPQTPDTIEANANNLPFADNSIRSIVYDPPFVFGINPPESENKSVIRKRFSSYKSMKHLFADYKRSIRQFARILTPRGVLVVKCQDVTDVKQYLTHVEIILQASMVGLACEDLFVVKYRNTPMIAPHWKKQHHARKNHFYFLVFIKGKKGVIYGQ